MMKIAVVDDRVEHRMKYSEEIRKSFRARGVPAEITQYQSALHLAEKLSDTEIAFLDVKMPGLDGLSFAKQLRSRNADIVIVFMSDYDSYVWDSFAADAVYFMRKRYFEQEIRGVTGKIMRLLQNRQQHRLIVEEGKQLHNINADRVLYIEAYGKLVILHFADHCMEIRKSFSAIEKQFAPCGFIRIHRSYLVNFHFIRRLTPDMAKLKNGEELPVSKQRSEKARGEYLGYLGEDM